MIVSIADLLKDRYITFSIMFSVRSTLAENHHLEAVKEGTESSKRALAHKIADSDFIKFEECKTSLQFTENRDYSSSIVLMSRHDFNVLFKLLKDLNIQVRSDYLDLIEDSVE